MKGRGNYLCLHRYERLQGQRRRCAPTSMRVHFAADRRLGARSPRPAIAPRSTSCPTTCRSGSRSPPPPRTAPAATCPRFADCFVTRMRQRAAESDVVIVNHHLLCADAALRHNAFGEVIPDSPRASSTKRTSSRTSRRSTSASRQQLPRRSAGRRRRARAPAGRSRRTRGTRCSARRWDARRGAGSSPPSPRPRAPARRRRPRAAR